MNRNGNELNDQMTEALNEFAQELMEFVGREKQKPFAIPFTCSGACPSRNGWLPDAVSMGWSIGE